MIKRIAYQISYCTSAVKRNSYESTTTKKLTVGPRLYQSKFKKDMSDSKLEINR